MCEMDADVVDDVGGFGWSAVERVAWDSATAQAAEGDQEKARPQDAWHDQENQRRRVQELLERIQHQVSVLLLRWGWGCLLYTSDAADE